MWLEFHHVQRIGHNTNKLGRKLQLETINMDETFIKSTDITKRHRDRDEQNLPLLNSSSDHIDKGWAWMVLLGSCLCHFLFRGQSTGLGVFYVEIRSSLNVSIVDVSVIGSLRNGFQNFIVVFTSPLAIHMGCRRMAVIGGVLSSAACLICYLWPTIYTFYVFFGVLTGLTNAMTYAASVMVVNNYFSKRRSFALAMLQSASSLGTVALSPLISFLLQEYGLNGSLLLSVGLSLNMVVGGMLYLPQNGRKVNPDRDGTTVKQIMKSAFAVYQDRWLWKNRLFYLSLISALLNGFTVYIPLQLLPDYMVSKGASLDVAAISVTVQGGAMTVTRFLSAVVTDRYPKLIRFLYIGGGVVASIFLFLIPAFDTSTQYILLATGFGLGFGSLSGLVTVMLVDLFGTHRLPACFGLSYMLTGVGGLIGTPIASSLAEVLPVDGIEYILAASTVAVCGLIMLPTLFVRRYTDDSEDERISLLSDDKSPQYK